MLPQRSRAASTGMVMVLSLARLSPSPDWLVSASAPDDSWRASMNFWHAASASPTAVMVLPQTSRATSTGMVMVLPLAIWSAAAGEAIPAASPVTSTAVEASIVLRMFRYDLSLTATRSE